MAHPWELRQQPWEARLDDDNGGIDEFEIDWDNIEPEFAGEQLFDMIIDLKRSGNITARLACVLAFWSHHAGSVGLVKSLKHKPNDPHLHHFSRKFDSASGDRLCKQNWLDLDVPVFKQFDCSRSTETISVIPPHEILKEELEQCPELSGDLQDRISRRELPPCYFQHPVVQAASEDENVHPAILYVDGVSFQKRDTLIGFWVYFLLSKTHHLCVALRKSRLCRCGCKGYCTFYKIFAFLHWSFLGGSRGEHPTERHDGPWRESDETRKAWAGESLCYKLAVCMLKCDISESCHTFGFPNWKHLFSPCTSCWATAEELFDFAISIMGLKQKNKTFADYTLACDSHELWLTVDKIQYTKIRGSIVPGGRELAIDIHELGLMKYDRLEPWEGLPDIGDFDHISVFPARILFWRPRKEQITHHRLPLFSEETGVTNASFVFDWLHVLSLGVYQFFCMFIIHCLITANVWKVAATNEPERIRLSVMLLERELKHWYTQQDKDITRISHLTPGMFGTCANQKLALQGAETNWFLPFVAFLIDKYEAELPNAALCRKACKSLLRNLELIREHRIVFPDPAVQEFIDETKRHLHMCGLLGIPMRYKHHAYAHLAADIWFFGSPAVSGCWFDEFLNGKVKLSASAAHHAVWTRRVLSDARGSFGLGDKRRGAKRRTSANPSQG